MKACPNIKSKEWSQLVEALGEDRAMLAFIRNNEEIPGVDKAKELITNVGLLESFEKSPVLTKEMVTDALKNSGLITGASKVIDGKTYYKLNKREDIATALEDFTNKYGFILEYTNSKYVRVNEQGLRNFNTVTSSNNVRKKTATEAARSFLSKLGITISVQDDIIEKYGSNGVADFAERMVKIQEGKIDEALPEEALHFFFDMIDQNTPELIEALDKIRDLPIYGETLRKYKDNPNYRTAEGNIRFDKIKKEALAKHVASLMKSKDLEKTNVFSKLWKAIVDAIKKIVLKRNPMEALQDMFYEADVRKLNRNIQSSEIYNQLEDEYQKFYLAQIKNATEDQKKSVQNILGLTQTISFEESTHTLKSIDTEGNEKTLTSVTRALGSDFYSELESPDVISEILREYVADFSLEAGLDIQKDTIEQSGKKIIDFILNKIVKSEMTEEEIEARLGERIKTLLFKAGENKRKTLFGTAVHSIAEAAILGKEIDLDALDPMIYLMMDRKKLEKLVYGTSSEPGIIGIIRNLKAEGSVVMTEIEIGNGVFGGIVDIIAVRPDGTIDIYDFKTKFVNKSTLYKKYDTLEEYFNYVTNLLSSGSVKNEPDTLPEMVGTRRSQSQKYAQQLSIYKKILMQAGFKVGNITVIGIPYSMDEKTNKVDDIKAFVYKALPFNDKIANAAFPGLDENMDANKKSEKKVEDDRIKYLNSIAAPKLKEAFAKMEVRLTQIFDYFKKNKDANAIYDMLTDPATKLNKVKLQKDIVTDITENFDQFTSMISAQRGIIDMIDSAGPILNILYKRFEELKNLVPGDTQAAKAKLNEMMKIRDFVVGYENMFAELLEYIPRQDTENPVVSRINEMVGVIQDMRQGYRKGITPEIIKMLGDVFSKSEVENMRREYNELIKSAEERGDKKRVEELKKELNDLPSDKVIAELLNGNKGDIGWFFGKFLPAISNPDIIISGVAKKLKATLDRVRLINKDFRDRLSKEFEKRASVYGKGLNVKDINESLTYITKVMDSRTGKEYDQLFFLSEFDEKLYYDYGKLLATLEKSRKEGTEDDVKEALKNVKDFEREYLQSNFTDEYYKLTAVLDKEVVYQGKRQTIREIRKEIKDNIRNIQKQYSPDDIAAGAMPESALKEIQAYNEKLSNLEQLTFLDGTPKTGDDLVIAKALQAYKENSKNMYEKVELAGLFERKKERIKLAYGENSEEYKIWIANNTKLAFSKKYYEDLEAINKELASLTQNPYADKIKELYDQLNVLTKPYKDKDGFVMAANISKQIVAQIRIIEEEISRLAALGSQYDDKGYTKEESEELRKQRYYKSISDPNHPDFGKYDITEELRIRNAKDERLKDKDEKAKFDRIKELKAQLFSMRKTEKTKYYYEELEKREKDFADNYIDDNGNKITYEQLKKDNRLYQKFRQSTWFQQNHIHKVRNMFDSVEGVYQESESWNPIRIWVRSVPVEGYIEEVPADHFFKFNLKESFIDENGKEVRLINKDNRDLLGRLKPKTNEEYRKQYKKDHPYLNEKFNSLKQKWENKTASAKERVDYENLVYLHKELTDAQQDIETRYRLGYAVPFMEKSKFQRTLETGGQNIKDAAKGMTESVKRSFTRTEADINEGIPTMSGPAAGLATMDNEEVRFIPVRFSSKSEASNASYDVWGAVLNYVASTNRKKELEKDLAFVNGLEELLSDTENQPKSETRNLIANKIFKKVFKDISPELEKKINLGSNTRAEVLKSFVNSVMYNEEYFEGYDILGVNTQKTISRLMKLSSFTLLGFAPFSWTVNFLSGNVQNIIESVGARFFSFRDFTASKKVIYSDSVTGSNYGSVMKDMISDYGKVGNRSFWGQVIEVFDPIQGKFENEFGQETNFNTVKNILQLGPFAGKIWGEWEIQMSAFIAFMKNHKLYNGKIVDRETFLTMKLGSDASGASMSEYNQKRLDALEEFDSLKVNLLDILELDENGKLGVKKQYKDSFELGSQEFSDLVGKLHFMQKRVNGSYAEFDKAYVQKTSLGRMLFFFRKYFLQLGMNRWGQRRNDYEGMSVEQGFYITFYQTFIKDLLRFRFQVLYNWSSYSPAEKRAISKTLVELGIILSVIALYSLVFGYDDDDEDRFAKLKKKSWGEQAALFVLLKVNSETGQFLPFAGFEELNRIYTNPSLIWSQITGYAQLSKMIFMHIGDVSGLGDFNKSLYYQEDSGESFLKEKGDSKFIANIAALAGYTGKTFNPIDAVKGFEFQQRMR